MSEYGRLPIPVIPRETNTIGTDPLPLNNIGLINSEQKEKPHNITIKNYNPNEPKRTPNMKYSDKQRYRRYKTKTEPTLLSKIQVNEEDDIINKIKEAFGIKPDIKNSNYSAPETSSVPFYKGVDETPVEQIRVQRERIPARPANRQQELMDEITDMSIEETEELTFKYAYDNEEWKRLKKSINGKTRKILYSNFC
jgi:hypothetical protein